jgi:integrase
VRVRLRGVHAVNKRLADGSIKVFHYHRATRTPLTGLPGSPEFIASFAEAEKAIRDRHAGMFNSLVRDYTLSIEFQKLAPSSQKEYKRMLTTAEVEFGTMPIAALNDPAVRQEFLGWRDKVARTSGPREADSRLTIISTMLSWGIQRGKIAANHVKGFERLYHVDRSQLIWTQDHINRFMKAAPVEMQRALILALNTGQREGDLIRLLWSAYDGTTLSLRQGKTGATVKIDCTSELRRMLDGMPRRAITILTSTRGQPFKQRHFISCWTEAMKKAGIEGLHFHDLRGTCVTRLAESGCSIQEVASITGHTLAHAHTILERYSARTEELARNAMAKFENKARTKTVNHAVNWIPARTDAND